MRRQSMPRIKFRQSLFWDVDPKTIDLKKHARYIIERIMDFGETGEVRWMRRYYPKRLLRSVVTKFRSLRPISKNFWNLITAPERKRSTAGRGR